MPGPPRPPFYTESIDEQPTVTKPTDEPTGNSSSSVEPQAAGNNSSSESEVLMNQIPFGQRSFTHCSWCALAPLHGVPRRDALSFTTIAVRPEVTLWLCPTCYELWRITEFLRTVHVLHDERDILRHHTARLHNWLLQVVSAREAEDNVRAELWNRYTPTDTDQATQTPSVHSSEDWASPSYLNGSPSQHYIGTDGEESSI